MAVLANYTDANDWLDETKVSFQSDSDAVQEAREATRYVQAALQSLFPDLFPTWDATIPQPVGTAPPPDIIRATAALLMASYRYARKYSEEDVGPSSYAGQLETRAMGIIQGLRDGTLTLEEEVSESLIAQPDFYPNDSTIITTDTTEPGLHEGDPDRAFGMNMRF